MVAAKLKLIVILCLMGFTSFGQDDKYGMSAPIQDLNRKGWNKVLCMNNGNTMLFHFEPGKKIMVKVFDSLHKQIASRKDNYRLMDILKTADLVLIGLYNINNEAVLFIDQDSYRSKHQLVRLRYNSITGMLMDETLVAESKSENKRIDFYVMKNKENDNYSILFSTDIRQPRSCDLFVVFFNNRHEAMERVQLDLDRTKYDSLDVIGAESQPNGVCITLCLSKKVMSYGMHDDLFGNGQDISPQRALYNHHVAAFYIPKGSNAAIKKVVDFSTDIYPYYVHYTYNPFARAVNLLMFSFRPIFYQFVLNVKKGAEIANGFLAYNEDSKEMKLNWVTNKMANDYLHRHTNLDTNRVYYGMPLKMFTNDRGLTTVISEGFEWDGAPETRARYSREAYLGNIAITQLDDDGNEIWGAVLPHAEYFNSYRHYYWPRQIAKKGEWGKIFGDLPKQVYARQFMSVNAYNYSNNYYVIFNDYERNFHTKIENPVDTVYAYEHTNACYYKMDGRKEVTKHYLLGAPKVNEYKCSFIEGADFDEKRGVYATLVQYGRGDNTSLRMAWSHLD